MAKNSRQKSQVAKRAYFSENVSISLADLLERIFENIEDSRNRIYQAPHERFLVLGLLETNPINSGVFLRVFEFEDGATGLISFSSKDAGAEIEELLPPENRKFLKDDATILVQENQIFSCGFGGKNKLLSNAIEALAQSCGLLQKDAGLTVEDLPNDVSLAEINRVGIKKLDFGLTDYLNSQSGDWYEKGVLGALFASPKSRAVHQKRASTKGRISLTRGRFKKDEYQKDEWLTDVGLAVHEDEQISGYTIVLENGKTVTARDLKRLKRVWLPRHASTVSYLAAKNALIDYAREFDRENSDDTLIE